jgi:hypothetical protein
MAIYNLDNQEERNLYAQSNEEKAKFRTPKFYQTVLFEIKGNVLDHVYPKLIYPELKGNITMTDRMGSDEAKCSECSNNEWYLLPGDSAAVREGGKPYIECLNCGFRTHL